MLVPLFARPGEAHLMASLGQKGDGLDLRGGMSVDDHWAWVAAASYANRDRCTSCNTSVRRHLEAGIGYISASPTGSPATQTPPGPRGSPRYRQWGWETYAGLGLGRIKASPYLEFGEPEPDEVWVTSGRYGMLFVQSGVGKRGVWTDNALNLRLVAYRFQGLSVADGRGSPVYDASGAMSVYLEPAYTLGLGYRAVKARAQFGASLPLVEPKALQSPKAWLSLGVACNVFGK